MPPPLPWTELARGLDEHRANEFLDNMKKFHIVKSQSSKCSVCGDLEPHNMNYQLTTCASETCKASQEECPWRGNFLTCSVSGLKNCYSLHSHIESCMSPRRNGLNFQQKDFCRQMAASGHRPMRILVNMTTQFSTGDSPSLRSVQNFCNNYLRSKCDNHDYYFEIAEKIQRQCFTGLEGDFSPFTFGWDFDVHGKLVVGDGSNQQPFLVGITTKTMLRRMDRPPSSFIFHMDATYKLNQVNFPILVMGISDSCRSFHLVAIFVVSQVTEEMHSKALASLRRVYSAVTQKGMVVQYVLGDADYAQYNACKVVFEDCKFTYIMCFFHVMVKVQERTKGLPGYLAVSVLETIYDMHFASSASTFQHLKQKSSYLWRQNPLLVPFAQYFEAVWLESSFSAWQCYLTPPGYATTNNPVEQFNRVLKRDYTLRQRLKMGTLLRELEKCCVHESTKPQIFRDQPEPSKSIQRRAKQLAKDGVLVLGNLAMDQMDPNVLAGFSLRVHSACAPRIWIPSRKRTEEYLATTAQMGVNYARMECAGQPYAGWYVNIQLQHCQCKYWWKFGSCIHLVYAFMVTNRLDSQGKRVL
ncbi:unnamed protein product [Phytophthora fragariaefolia]|uniref:Unnamed protein product n=1 Tax=Phytophthora fragariaefolia TaxID=1490495 RepID=A0A9W6TLA1_9STRA|nr:unnamed protein product [Phytophthora fragariaefolia]